MCFKLTLIVTYKSNIEELLDFITQVLASQVSLCSFTETVVPKMPEEHCNHIDCSHRYCSDIDCSHCICSLLPHQYTTVEDLQDQLSDILEILGSSYACLTASTSTDKHSRLPELKEQVLSRMSDHSHSITIMASELGMQHPIVTKHKQAHDSMEGIVSTLIEMVRLGSLHRDTEEILTRITARLAAQKGSDMHSGLHDLKDQQD